MEDNYGGRSTCSTTLENNGFILGNTISHIYIYIYMMLSYLKRVGEFRGQQRVYLPRVVKGRLSNVKNCMRARTVEGGGLQGICKNLPLSITFLTYSATQRRSLEKLLFLATRKLSPAVFFQGESDYVISHRVGGGGEVVCSTRSNIWFFVVQIFPCTRKKKLKITNPYG